MWKIRKVTSISPAYENNIWGKKIKGMKSFILIRKIMTASDPAFFSLKFMHLKRSMIAPHLYLVKYMVLKH